MFADISVPLGTAEVVVEEVEEFRVVLDELLHFERHLVAVLGEGQSEEEKGEDYLEGSHLYYINKLLKGKFNQRKRDRRDGAKMK